MRAIERRLTDSAIASFALVVGAIGMLVTGCNLRPDFRPPGTVMQQRNRAVVHDPFPNDDLGPTIEGARPMDFERPLSEPTDLQTNPTSNFGRYGY